MNKKVFKTGDVITPEFLNALQNPSFEKSEGEVGYLPKPNEFENIGKVKLNEKAPDFRFLEDYFNRSVTPEYRIGNIVFTVSETRGGLILAGDVISGWEIMGVSEATTLNQASDKDYNIWFSGSDYTVTIEPNFLKGLTGNAGKHFAVLHNLSNGKISIRMKCAGNGHTWYDEMDLPEGISFLYYVSGEGFSVYRLQSFNASIEYILNQVSATFLAKTGGKISGSLTVSEELNADGLLVVKKIRKNIGIPESLTTNDSYDSLGEYMEIYKPDSLDVFRIPDHYNDQGIDVGMSTDFYLTNYKAEVGSELVIHNIGTDDLTIHWNDYTNNSKTVTISSGCSKKFIALNESIWNAMT